MLCSFVVLSVVDRQYGYNTVGVVIYMYYGWLAGWLLAGVKIRVKIAHCRALILIDLLTYIDR